VFGETTVITKVSVGQFVVCPGAHTGIVYVYVPAAVAVNVYVPFAPTVIVAPVICAGCP
jgi:hypothetical protein